MIKLLEQVMKVHSRARADAGKASWQKKKAILCIAFVDLEKTFNRMPREVARWALRKAGVEEW